MYSVHRKWCSRDDLFIEHIYCNVKEDKNMKKMSNWEFGELKSCALPAQVLKL